MTPTHINPGTDTTINPVAIDDSYRERKPKGHIRKCLHPEKYRECGLTVGLCSCVQENKGVPEKDCGYCYGTGVFVYTSTDLPTPSNCPHWVKDDIYVKGFRCSLYRDTHTPAHPPEAQQRINAATLKALINWLNEYEDDVTFSRSLLKSKIALLQAGRK